MGSAWSFAVVRADLEARARNALLLGGLVLWMLYTRAYFALHGIHATIPACPFLTITGHPCPFCGGTRAFAYVWRGDLRHALLLYPLGPLLFAATVVAIPLLLVAVVSGRDARWRLGSGLRRSVLALVLVAIAASWALKLTVLPN